MAESSGEKTFDATPHRREQAREKGQTAYSQDLGSAALLLVAAGLLRGFGPRIAEDSAELMQRHLGQPMPLVADRGAILGQLHEIAWAMGLVMIPMFGFLLLAAVGSSLV